MLLPTRNTTAVSAIKLEKRFRVCVTTELSYVTCTLTAIFQLTFCSASLAFSLGTNLSGKIFRSARIFDDICCEILSFFLQAVKD